MDVDRYRKRYEAELAKVSPPAEKRRQRKRSSARKSSSRAATAAALGAGPVEERNLGGLVEALLATVLDQEQPVATRAAALGELGALDFLGPRFDPFRAPYKEALRKLATDRSRTLREPALERLAIDKDPYAQELLIRGLEQPKDSLVSDAKAMQFLGHDDHAELAPLARRVYKRSTGVAREEALRLLATDPRSERLFTRLLKDKEEKSSVRRLSASALQSMNPKAFERAATAIVGDDSDFNEIRATSMAALAHGREAHDREPNPKVIDAAQKLATDAKSAALRASSKRFLRATGA